MLQCAATGGLGLTLAECLRLAEAGEIGGNQTAMSAIFLDLYGGPSHLDTFDFKPDARSEFRGDFKSIDSAISGVAFPDTLPQLARLADKFCIVRGITHNLGPHGLAREYVYAGNRKRVSLDFPSLGSVVSRVYLPKEPGVPGYIAIPASDAGTGYFGVEFAPFETKAIPKPGCPFSIPGLSMASGNELQEFNRRRQLLEQIDRPIEADAESNKLLRGLGRFRKSALDIVSSNKMKEAMNLPEESQEVRTLFGDDSLSQSCLLAVRFIEAGTRFVSVRSSGWDTHQDNFSTLRDRLCPTLDLALSGLIRALEQKGLLETTVVIAHGEFGRTPKINKDAGREHWPAAMCAVLAGGAIAGGTVVGSTDRDGMYPDTQGFTPDDLFATILTGLRIDPKTSFSTASGREIQLVRDGQSIDQVFTS
mgnify:FL=1